MALSQYRVKFKEQFAGYNAGETGWFTSQTATAIVAAGVGTAVDATPSTALVIAPAPGLHKRAFVTRRWAQAPTSQADSDLTSAEACVYVGF
jgi:hypothetical protein